MTELERCVERADLDPDVHVLLLSGKGKGFCGGYDLVESAEGQGRSSAAARDRCAARVAARPGVMAANHDPAGTWDPMVDYAMMSRNVRAFMSLFHCSKPVVCKVHGFCVAGGTDMALCSDLLVIAADAKIGYPPARVWGSPTTSMWAYRLGPQRAKRLLFTGDSLSGDRGARMGARDRGAGARGARRADRGAGRADRAAAGQPAADDEAARQPVAVLAGTARDAGARDRVRRDRAPHQEGYAFQQLAAREGFRAGRARARRAVRRLGPMTEETARPPPASGCCAPRRS